MLNLKECVTFWNFHFGVGHVPRPETDALHVQKQLWHSVLFPFGINGNESLKEYECRMRKRKQKKFIDFRENKCTVQATKMKSKGIDNTNAD